MATLDHPLVPRYIGHFEEEGELYLVMEKVEGETLDAIRRREGPLSETEVRRFLACADRALTYLHGRASPIVHRDVKPRNVVRRPDGSYVFVDFGAVSELLVRKGSSTIVGTMGYMAPEQFQGRALTGTDVYAVGATALAALTGAEPETLPHQGLRVDVRAALGGRTSPELVTALERMLEPDPDKRAKSVTEALDGLHTTRPSAAPAPIPTKRAPIVQVDATNEDAVVKSIRKLLWLLWGLGWVIVPLLLRPFHAQQMIPLVMFGSLAMLFVVTWHKGALIRAALRSYNGDAREDRGARPRVFTNEPSARPRVASEDPQVRVRTSDLSHEETVGDTVVGSEAEESRKQRRRR